MQIHVVSWNLFHGRDEPPGRALHSWRSRLLKFTERGPEYAQVNRSLFAEFATALSAMRWDVALLQECPTRWGPRLTEALGAESHRVLTSRNQFSPLSGWLAEVNPDLIASWEGGSNLTLVRGALLGGSEPAIAERRELVIHEGRPERRTMAFTRTAAGLCAANLHATNDRPEIAGPEVLRAAATAVEWAAGAPLLFGGDLNLRPAEQPKVFERLARRVWPRAADRPRCDRSPTCPRHRDPREARPPSPSRGRAAPGLPRPARALAPRGGAADPALRPRAGRRRI